MKKYSQIRIYTWIEFVIWLIIVAITIFGFRYYNYQHQKMYKNYQIFMDDVDGLIVGSPVKFLGIQVGHVKKIKVVSSTIYVKFVITQKNLELPIGSIATVEGTGLGGSKSLEIYPPDKTASSDKIIVPKSPTRLGKVLTLFKGIFKELDSILTAINNATVQLQTEEMPKNLVQPADANVELYKLDNKLEEVQKSKDSFINSFKNKEPKNE